MMATTNKKTHINILVDWSQAFVDAKGSFYCGATETHKDLAVKVARTADIVVYTVDVHSKHASEFEINGGLFPVHNLIKKDELHPSAQGKNTSCRLTEKLQTVVQGRRAGLIVPRCVQLQDYNGGATTPAFSISDVEYTFDMKHLDPRRFSEYDYIVNAKSEFNGVSLYSTALFGNIAGANNEDYNAFTLLRRRFGLGDSVEFSVTGVVLGICVYQTASNCKQMFPRANVTIVIDACAPLCGEGTGMKDPEHAESVVRAMCQQLGVKVATTEEYLAGK